MRRRWTGSTAATAVHRGSSTCPGRRGSRRRRAAPRATGRRRARARRSTGSRAVRRRTGTRSPDRPRAGCAAGPGRRRRTTAAAPAAVEPSAEVARARPGRRGARPRTLRSTARPPVRRHRGRRRAGARATTAQGSRPGRRRPARGPRRRRPAAAGVPATSSIAAPASSIRAMRCHVPACEPDARARRPRRRRQSRARGRSGGSRVASSRLTPAGEGVGGQLPFAGARRRRAATAATAAYQGNAHAAASGPAASAITWLFAEEPRLGKAARYSWCHAIWRSASGSFSNRSPTLRPVVQQPPDPHPGRAGGPRPRSRWSSARRRGTGWPATRSAAGRRRPPRSARRRSATTPRRAP